VRRQRANSYLVGLTPAGFGVLVVFFPGLVLALGSGQRWMAALSIGAGLLLVANTVITRIMLGRIRLDARAPAIAIAGQPFEFRLHTQSPRSAVCAVNAGHTDTWVPCAIPGQIVATTLIASRGVFQHVTIGVQTSMPLNLVAFLRRAQVELGAPIHVGPAPVKASLPSMQMTQPAVGCSPVGTQQGEPAGIRQFVHGDSYRDVHWATTARTGTMKVRDRRERSIERTVAATIEAADEGESDQVLGHSYTVLSQLLAGGVPVELTTLEPAVGGDCGPARSLGRRPPRPVTARVDNQRELIRRLARVQLGPIGSRPSGSKSCLVVDERGSRWQHPG